MMDDLSDEDLKKELQTILDGIKTYRDSIYTEDVDSDVIAKRLWDTLSSTRGGKLFLANLSFNLLDMFIDASRRSAEKPDLAVEQLSRSMARDRLLTMLPDDLKEQVKKFIPNQNGFGEFVPGMYEKEEQ